MKRISDTLVIALVLAACLLVFFVSKWAEPPKVVTAHLPIASTGDVGTTEGGVFRLNLNTATAGMLTGLPGIGESLSQRIVDYREANGPFQSVDDLLNVSGIGQGKLAAIAPYLTVN